MLNMMYDVFMQVPLIALKKIGNFAIFEYAK